MERQLRILISLTILLLNTQRDCAAQYFGSSSPPYVPPASNYAAPAYNNQAPSNPVYSNNYRGNPGYGRGGFRSYVPGFAPPPPQQSFNGGYSGLNPQTQSVVRERLNSASATAPRSTAALEQMLNHAAGPTGFAHVVQGLFPGVSRQEMTRVFFDGGSPQSGPQSGSGYQASAPSGNSSANTSTAYSNYQTACNEETKARNDANTARNNRDKWNRKNAASQAYYAANNAEYAAQRAESSAYSGDSQARGYANLARQAANRARQSANQARYNADTIQ